MPQLIDTQTRQPLAYSTMIIRDTHMYTCASGFQSTGSDMQLLTGSWIVSCASSLRCFPH